MRYAWLFFLISGLSSLSAQDTTKPDSIMGTRLTQWVVLTDSLGGKHLFDSSEISIYAKGHFRLCDLTYRFSSGFNGIELVTELRHHYFVYSTDSRFGIDYDGHKTPMNSKLPVDSTLDREWFYHNNLSKTFSQSTADIISSINNDATATLDETYLLKSKTDPSSQATCELSYVKQPTGFWSNPLGDPLNKKDMRLSKVRMISDCVPCKTEIIYLIDEIKEIKPDIIGLFNDYIKYGSTYTGN